MFPALVKLLGGVRATVFAAVALLALVLVGVQTWRLSVARGALDLVATEAVVAKRLKTELEGRARAEIFDIRNQLAEATNEAELERNRLLAQLRSGERRLRERFTCRAAGTPAGAEGSADAPQGGLSPADGEFLVRFAADADSVVRQLTACQAILKADRR
ncbi:lysis system i-spanin subunit Rz [Flavobacterium sp.]|jgi:prophage endopeptidase|uniref:lysis system i-spanin subunit Rz n=1 Tax=Flavobacterium sp. TaxID=239 RepID=UPI0037C0E239